MRYRAGEPKLANRSAEVSQFNAALKGRQTRMSPKGAHRHIIYLWKQLPADKRMARDYKLYSRAILEEMREWAEIEVFLQRGPNQNLARERTGLNKIMQELGERK